MIQFFKSTRIYMLVLLPIVVVGATLMAYLHGKQVPTFNLFGYDFSTLGTQIIAAFSYVAIILLQFFLNERNRFLLQRTTLPITLYTILTGGAFYLGVDYHGVIVSLILLLGLNNQFSSYEEGAGNSSNFNIGFLYALAALISPVFLFLPIYGLLSIFFFYKNVKKGVVGYLIGILALGILRLGYFVWESESLEFLYPTVKQFYTLLDWERFSTVQWGCIGVIFFLIFLSLVNNLTRPRSLSVSQRKGVLTIDLLLFSIAVAMINQKFIDMGAIYLFAIPFSFLYSTYLLSCRRSFGPTILFLLFLASSVLFYLF